MILKLGLVVNMDKDLFLLKNMYLKKMIKY